MASPVGFPSGLTTFPKRHVLSSYPISTSPRQIALTDDFMPYRAADYTVTTAVAGTVASFPLMGGAVKLATSASATDTIFMSRNGQGYQFLPGMQLWFDAKICIPRSVQSAVDVNGYVGLFASSNPTTTTDGVYFYRLAGGSGMYLVIKSNGTSTLFGPIADLATPSGISGDANSVNGSLNCNISSNALTAVSVATAGSGYQCAPIVLSTATSGVTGNVGVTVGLGSSSFTPGNPSTPIQSTALPYSSLYAPYIIANGSGYTNGTGTTLLEVEPVINVQFYWDGKATLFVGVNGRVLVTLGSQGVTPVTAGSTVSNVLTAPSQAFYMATQLPTNTAPVQPPAGSAYNALPRVPLSFAAGLTNTTANIRTMYVLEHNIACEYL